MANQHEPKTKPGDTSPGHAPDKPAEGDKAPVAVAGPEARRRERPEPRDTDESLVEEEGDKAPVAVAGPEAQAREKK